MHMESKSLINVDVPSEMCFNGSATWTEYTPTIASLVGFKRDPFAGETTTMCSRITMQTDESRCGWCRWQMAGNWGAAPRDLAGPTQKRDPAKP